MRKQRGGLKPSRRYFAALENLEPRTFLSAVLSWGGTWRIQSELNPSATTDTVTVQYSATDPTMLEAYINGVLVESLPARKVRTIQITGTDRPDVITGNFTGGKAIRMVVFGKGGDDVITTGDANDWIDGGSGNDTINSGGGNDVIYGGAGDDVITAGSGNDRIYGGSGNDTINAGDGNDYINGQAGDDTISAGAGRNRIDGGGGNDRIFGSTRLDKIVKRAGTLVASAATSPLIDATTLSQLRQQLIDEAVSQYQSLYGTTYTRYWWDWGGPIVSGPITVTFANGTVGAVLDTSSGTTGTNNQVSSVDEADLVKTDGTYIYLLASDAQGSKLTIIDAANADQPVVLSTTEIVGIPKAVFVDGDQVAVVTEDGPWFVAYPMLTSQIGSIFQQGQQTSPHTYVTVFNVANHSKPVETEQTMLNGRAEDVRSTGGQVYVTLQESLYLPGPRSYAVDSSGGTLTGNGELRVAPAIGSYPTSAVIWFPGGPVTTYQYETEAEYRAYLESIIDSYLPGYTLLDAAGTATASGGLSGGILLPEKAGTKSIETVVDINLRTSAPGPEGSVSVYGNYTDFYATPTEFYLAGTDWGTSATTVSGPVTDLVKLDIGPGKVQFAASGAAPGYLLNSYSMDESNGFLHVATTTWDITGWTTTLNGVYVLQQNGTSLDVVGLAGDLAPGERIQSVRFMGAQAYVVTYLRTDPLFVLDLSDPTSPQVAGELTLPGFSSYLQMIDATHLLGIGSMDNHFSGSQLDLFDVSDPANPTLIQQASMGAGSYTDAQWDPHAVSYFRDAGILVIPISSGNNNGFEEFQVNPATGFTDLGTIAGGQWSGGRALEIAGRVYTIAGGSINVTAMGAPGTVIASLSVG